MCGIYCAISRHEFTPLTASLKSILQSRGPDCFQHRTRDVFCLDSPNIYISIASTVLALRGNTVISQPLFDESVGSFFCWNGEAWKFNGREVSGNDSQTVFGHLLDAANGSDIKIADALGQINGPYAFVFYDSRHKKLYFGRDCLGRRSLLKSYNARGDLVLSSVSDLSISEQWVEVEADGVNFIDFGQNTEAPSDRFRSHHIPYEFESIPGEDNPTISLPFPRMNKAIPEDVPTSVTSDAHTILSLESLVRSSIRLRICNIRPSNDLSAPPSNTNVAILFSGGLDCTILARLSNDLLPPSEPIDLLNVAFENPRIHNSSIAAYEACPDRLTARRSLAELRFLCPARTFRLVLINIPYAETLSHRPLIKSLMHPHDTEMDLSIATALFFASRGVGIVEGANGAEPYKTSARVLLSGLGADELFAGYQRHGIAFQQRGYNGLVEELELDFRRLGKRNLGRDDRVLSHWGKEARYPYLDEDVVAWAMRANVWEKCGFGCRADARNGVEPGKLVLRLLAMRLGLSGVAREKKRAIQFGARTAKMERGRVKGTEKVDSA